MLQLFGMFMAYAFVLLWHGTDRHNIIWIVLNVTELLVEQVSKGVYAVPSVRLWREAHISDTVFRRILGALSPPIGHITPDGRVFLQRGAKWSPTL